ncbi:MAG: DinB family protein [Chloroflexota bacterium]
MSDNVLARLFEHNNWANLRIIEACTALSNHQLDAEPQSATFGSIRVTLTHMVAAQQGYLSLLTLPIEARHRVSPSFAELSQVASSSGAGLLELARNEAITDLKTRVQTTDGYFIEPWVVLVQAINHATEHREQINSMISALGVTPPELDGWTYGEVTEAVVLISR